VERRPSEDWVSEKWMNEMNEINESEWASGEGLRERARSEEEVSVFVR